MRTVKLDHFPQGLGVKIPKILSCHHLGMFWIEGRSLIVASFPRQIHLWAPGLHHFPMTGSKHSTEQRLIKQAVFVRRSSWNSSKKKRGRIFRTKKHWNNYLTSDILPFDVLVDPVQNQFFCEIFVSVFFSSGAHAMPCPASQHHQTRHKRRDVLAVSPLQDGYASQAMKGEWFNVIFKSQDPKSWFRFWDTSNFLIDIWHMIYIIYIYIRFICDSSWFMRPSQLSHIRNQTCSTSLA